MLYEYIVYLCIVCIHKSILFIGIMINSKKKIVYTVTSLGNSGGIERVLINKVNWLIKNGGYDVYIITEDSKDPFYQVDPRINILSLNITKRFSKYLIIRLFRLVVFLICYGFKISRFLRQINPGIVISANARDNIILPFVHRKSKKIYEYHWIVSKKYSKNKQWKGCISKKVADVIGNRYDSIILLTKQDKLYNNNNWSNVEVIPNARTFTCDTPAKLSRNRAIAVGNLFHIKGFGRLLDVWRIVHQRHPDWSLSIYGDGYLREELQLKIDNLSLTDVVKLEGKIMDIKDAYIQSSFSLCSSYEESFSMVILEAQTCGLPVVAFDCPYGPSEIINDRIDGFLIPDGEIQNFADKVCLLIENEELRKKMGHNAFNNSERFAEDKIMSLWIQLFDK